ncbi:hypothetical protein [Nocardia panacis]|uniref:hypothetical protein n=1 Tax=Nocardia panacis TaxID=2340916 RepID=UPI0011C43214|nr:hypothetical protein [Nocardia panacis]
MPDPPRTVALLADGALPICGPVPLLDTGPGTAEVAAGAVPPLVAARAAGVVPPLAASRLLSGAPLAPAGGLVALRPVCAPA